MKDKRIVSIALVSMLALSVFAAMSAASAVPDNPLAAISNALNGIYSYLTGTIKPDIDDINAKTDAIKNQVDKGSQVLTRTETVTLLAGTPPPTDSSVYYLVSVDMGPYNAADFRVTVATIGGDWTPETGDHLAVGASVGSTGTLSWVPIYVSDTGLSDDHWQTEFTARRMSIYIQLADTLTNDVHIYYSYTVTTEAGATIIETITPPPTPP